MSAWNHVELTCYRGDCGTTIALHQGHYERLRQTGERFFCPNGHGQVFKVGPDEKDKRIAQLERRITSLDEFLEREQDHHQLMHDAVKRGPQVCPLGCGWVGSRRLPWYPDESEIARFYDRVHGDLREHLTSAHNATLKTVALLTERAESTP